MNIYFQKKLHKKECTIRKGSDRDAICLHPPPLLFHCVCRGGNGQIKKENNERNQNCRRHCKYIVDDIAVLAENEDDLEELIQEESISYKMYIS